MMYVERKSGSYPAKWGFGEPLAGVTEYNGARLSHRDGYSSWGPGPTGVWWLRDGEIPVSGQVISAAVFRVYDGQVYPRLSCRDGTNFSLGDRYSFRIFIPPYPYVMTPDPRFLGDWYIYAPLNLNYRLSTLRWGFDSQSVEPESDECERHDREYRNCARLAHLRRQLPSASLRRLSGSKALRCRDWYPNVHAVPGKVTVVADKNAQHPGGDIDHGDRGDSGTRAHVINNRLSEM